MFVTMTAIEARAVLKLTINLAIIKIAKQEKGFQS